jgi:transposase
MALYCGIDLHSTNCWVAVVEDGREVIREKRIGNDLATILEFLEPHRPELEGIAVESTFNWYWLVDGLMGAGYKVHLTNTWAAKQYEGLKYADDRHDARWLAHLLWLGILPEGYIYPKEERDVRDLLRRRTFLVHKRTSIILAMKGAFACRTGMNVRSDDIKKWTAEDVGLHIEEPLASLGITCLLGPMAALSEQIKVLEKESLKRGRIRDEYKHLTTVWGIGKILALTIMYEVGEIERFARVGNFASYCRCVKSDWLTNGKRKGSGNSRNGNPYLSWAFSEAAHFAVMHQDRAKKYVQRKRAKTNGIVAVRALAHKLARASYYVMKDQVDFDPERLFA